MGFARDISSGSSTSLSATGGMIGTPAYMAPELWRAKPASPASDIYALGCILYEMLTGQVLFEGESPADVMTKHVLDGSQLTDELPQAVSAFLMKALAKDPQDRYPDARAFLSALHGFEAAPEGVERVVESVHEPAPSSEQPELHEAVIPEEEIAATEVSREIQQPERITLAPSQPVIPPPERAPYVSPYQQPGMGEKPASNTWKWVTLTLIVIGGIVGLLVSAINRANQPTGVEYSTSTPEIEATETAYAIAVGTQKARIRITQTAVAEAYNTALANVTRNYGDLVLGPRKGKLDHYDDGFVEISSLLDEIQNFILDATFITPYDSSSHG